MSAAPRLRQGIGTIGRVLRDGQTVSAAASQAKWRHPWQVSTAWNGDEWRAVVQPGFVNGKCPVRETTDGDMPLYRRPEIPLRWRRIGWDGDGAVPQFFLDRGAAKARPELTVAAVEANGASAFDTPEAPENLRLLRACDLWIHQPRLALTSQIDITPEVGLLTGRSIVSQTLSVKGPVATDTLRVLAGTLERFERGIDPITNLYEEESWDDLTIATVFALSPRKTPAGSEPDSSWQLFVRHNLFWNLNYVLPYFRQFGGVSDLPFIPPLGGGAGVLIINYLIASLNDLTQEAINRISAHSMRGTFYTPTGGGHTAEPPPIAESTVRTGLNKSARNKAVDQARARARRSLSLDPAFPYRAEPFAPQQILAQPI